MANEKVKFVDRPIRPDEAENKFVDREEEFIKFIKFLEGEGTKKIILIVGTSGTGKTSFANALRAIGQGKPPRSWENYITEDIKNYRWIYFSFLNDTLVHEVDFWTKIREQQVDTEKFRSERREIREKTSSGKFEDVLKLRSEEFREKVMDDIKGKPTVLILDDIEELNELDEEKQEIVRRIIRRCLEKESLHLVLISPLPFKGVHASDDSVDGWPQYDGNPVMEEVTKRVNSYIPVISIGYINTNPLEALDLKDKVVDNIKRILPESHMFYLVKLLRKEHVLITEIDSDKLKDIWKSFVKRSRHQWEWITDQVRPDRRLYEAIIESIETQNNISADRERDLLKNMAICTKDGELIISKFLVPDIRRDALKKMGCEALYYNITTVGFVLFLIGLLAYILMFMCRFLEWSHTLSPCTSILEKYRLIPTIILCLGSFLFFGSMFHITENRNIKTGVILLALTLPFLMSMLSIIFYIETFVFASWLFVTNIIIIFPFVDNIITTLVKLGG